MKPSHVETIVQLQRSFRKATYNFMRVPLVERLRLELRLEVVGGRVIVWLILLILVCLNLFATIDSTPYTFEVSIDLESALGIANISSSHTWNEVYSRFGTLANTLYDISSRSYQPQTSKFPLPEALQVSGPYTIVAPNRFSVTTWLPTGWSGPLVVKGRTVAPGSIDCFTLEVSPSSIKYTDHVTGNADSTNVVTASGSNRSMLYVYFGLHELSMSVNGGVLKTLTYPDRSLPSHSCYTTGLTLKTTQDLFVYDGEISDTRYKQAYALKLPFVADVTTNPFLFQSVPERSSQSLSPSVKDFEVMSAGSIAVTLPTVATQTCTVAGSLESAVSTIYGAYSMGSSWCAPATTLSASSFMPQGSNLTTAFLDYGFFPDSSGQVMVKPLSALLSEDLQAVHGAALMELQFVLRMRSTDRLFFYRVTASATNVGTERYETVLHRPERYSGDFAVTAIGGIVVSAFFLLKDIIVFVVNVFVWTRERELYQARRIAGVLGTRRKMIAWMTANVLTNASVLVLLVARYSYGDMAEVARAQLASLPTPATESWAADSVSLDNGLDGLYNAFITFTRWEHYGVVVFYILLARVVHSLSGHPRVGILTATWRMAFDDLIHLLVVFFTIFQQQAVIGLLLMWDRSSQMTNYKHVTLSQWHALVSGVWDSTMESFDIHGRDWVISIYFLIFLVTTRVLTLNFFIAVQIDAYMAVREHVMSHSTAQSFLKDAIETAEAKFLVKFGYIPNRQKIIALLIHMYAKPEVTHTDLQQGWAFATDDQLNRFCRRYWFKYPQVRSREEEDVASADADWRTVLAEIEILRDLVTPPTSTDGEKSPKSSTSRSPSGRSRISATGAPRGPKTPRASRVDKQAD